jgi:hypothetical protein
MFSICEFGRVEVARNITIKHEVRDVLKFTRSDLIILAAWLNIGACCAHYSQNLDVFARQCKLRGVISPTLIN